MKIIKQGDISSEDRVLFRCDYCGCEFECMECECEELTGVFGTDYVYYCPCCTTKLAGELIEVETDENN
jgi:hypothetical protein